MNSKELTREIAELFYGGFCEPEDKGGDDWRDAVHLAEQAIPIIRKALSTELEEKVFYVDNRGYIALKPNATSNWQALKGETDEE